MSYGVDQYTQDCLSDYGYAPDLDALRPDAELESLAATPEGLGLDRAEMSYMDPITEAIEAMHQDERARAMRRMVMA